MKTELQIAGCKLKVSGRNGRDRKGFNRQPLNGKDAGDVKEPTGEPATFNQPSLRSYGSAGLQPATCNLQPATFNQLRGFTIAELLVVIAILGILAALAVPALKNLGKSNVNVGAARQLLDDVGRARQLAMSQRTTVYMVFVPANFWMPPCTPSSTWTNTLNSLTPPRLAAAANLLDKQMTGYILISHGAMGDQPGEHAWHYLTPWQNLPPGNIIAPWKFSSPVTYIFDPVNYIPASPLYAITNFQQTVLNAIPFPTADTPVTAATAVTNLPYIAFNYLGQLTSEQVTPAARQWDEYIPLSQGDVMPAINASTKALLFGSAQILESPPGNSTNLAYNLVHIDWLTGRAVLEYHKLGP